MSIRAPVEDQDTFQNWLDATNLLITQLREGTSQTPIPEGIPFAYANSLIDTDWLDHQQSKLDDTQGRLLQVGAFGLGDNAVAVPNGNLDSFSLDTGVYSVSGASPLPPGFSASDGVMFHLRLNADNASQMLFDLAGRSIWRRGGDTTNGWSDWFKILDTADSVSLDYTDVSADFSAAMNTGYTIDASQAITATLPATPEPVNGEIHFYRRNGSWSSNPTTVARNGQTIEGNSDDLVIDSDLIQIVKLKWVSDGTWRVFQG